MTLLKKIDNIFAKILDVFCIFCMSSLGVILCAKVFFRFVPLLSAIPTFSMGWFDELIEMLFAWLIMTCSTLLCRENAHFRVDLIQMKLKGRALAVLEIAVYLVALVFYALLFYYGASLCATAVQTTATLRWQMRYFYLCIPFNAFFLCVYTVRNIVYYAMRLVHPQTEDKEETT